MNLEKLIAEREYISAKSFPIPGKELLLRFEQLYTGAVNDVLREFSLLNQALPAHIVPLREYHSVAGFAFTVKSAPNVLIRGEMEVRTNMLEDIHEDAFVMWDSSHDTKSTFWGGVMTATAKSKKVKAAQYGKAGHSAVVLQLYGCHRVVQDAHRCAGKGWRLVQRV